MTKVDTYYQKNFSNQELKILTYNKVKEGMSYDKAVEQVKKEIASCMDVKIKLRKKAKKNKPSFEEEFKKIKNGEKR